MDPDAEREAGERLMTELWRIPPAAGHLPQEFHSEFIVRHLYGRIWSRPLMSTRLRSIVTTAILTAAGRKDEAFIHIHGARNQGVSRQELEELMIHLGQYVGMPLAVMGLGLVHAAFSSESGSEAQSERLPQSE